MSQETLHYTYIVYFIFTNQHSYQNLLKASKVVPVRMMRFQGSCAVFNSKVETQNLIDINLTNLELKL